MTEPAASSDLTAPAQPATPPAPQWRPQGFPTAPASFDAPEAMQAREQIKELIGDRTFYEQLKSERERGVMGEASQKWANLHKAGWPSAPGIASPEDVSRQQDARNEEAWNSYIAALNQQFQLTPENIAEIRGGVISEQWHRWARDEKDRLIRDKGFYRRLLDGDRQARKQWGTVTAMLSLRPVKPQ
jgi:hypothetical protein